MKSAKNKRTKPGFTKADLAAVSDNPEWTKEDFAKAKTFSGTFPDLAKTIRRRGPQKTPTKQPVSLRLSPDVIEHYKAKGPGWQSQIDDDLRKIANRAKKRKAS
ncbi:BrnA antitoxin family protein [Nitrobacter sp. TKz-YC02]|uniref:BrnA antitoxin family protein n=1 Tax=Nitrobacter sp. TKz-YC02 TaxID=3398704 RepID=UPI003CF20C0C